MKYGVRNDLMATVQAAKKGEIMSQIECTLDVAGKLSSVLTIDSVAELDLKPGDTVHLLIKAIHVIPAKD